MATRRLVEYHLERLKNKNPDIRKDSIEQLRLLGDPAALSALEHVFHHDEVLELRLLAQEAGREIFFKQNPSKKG
ncbi:MAG TPA: HEAT repeat domain-containing protein [Aggregatilineales bacterium]|nr:HEAT repeat domain-containing protein [Anaerolineales bacterium]HRE46406.1 HEAT repeat domain-containing protein [Aggregatilineales bacterium]